MYGKNHTLTKNLYNLTSKTATINITKYILNIMSFPQIILPVFEVDITTIQKNITCSFLINKNELL
jgi:hypothetical protein